MDKANTFLLLCGFTLIYLIGWTVAQDEIDAPELSHLEITVRKLMDKVEHLERKLQSIESNPLAAYFQDKSHIRKRGYTHSYNTYEGNGTFVFCGNNLKSFQRRSAGYSHSYNDYTGDGTFVYCGGSTAFQKQSTGISYIIWGKESCPNGQTLYSGVIGGNYVRHSAGGSNQVCLPNSPQYGQYSSGAQQRGLIFPSKYDTSTYSNVSHVHGKLATCAACYNSGSSTSIMIPAAVSCPDGWNQEYYGYLMSQPDIPSYYRYSHIICD